jgi:hypothetical protein
MNNLMERISTCSLVLLFVLFLCTSQANAGLDDWIIQEVIPTVKGNKPLKIKQFVRVTHNGKKRIELSNNSAFIKIGDVTIKTNQLRERLVQIGCIVETGNIVACAPDVLEQELLRVANSGAPSGRTYSSASPFDYFQECLWKPKISYDNRNGQLTVYNTSSDEKQVTLWHPDTLSPFSTWKIPARQGATLSNGNEKLFFGSDWGIEVANNELPICTLQDVTNWVSHPQGNHWYFYLK